MVAAGLITALTVNVEPVQLPDVGVTLYTAVAAFAVVLVSVPFTSLWPVPDAPPVMLAPVGLLHAYVVPAGIVPVGV